MGELGVITEPPAVVETPAEQLSNQIPSEQDPTPEITFPTETIYKHTAIWLGGFLGGPLMVTHIIASNFGAFGETQKAAATWIVGLIATVAIFGIAFMMDGATTTNSKLLPALYIGVAYALIRHYQGEKIDAHIKTHGATHSWARIVGVSLLSSLVTFIPLIVIAMTVELNSNQTSNRSSFAVDSAPPAPRETPTVREYQALKHEIYFLQSNVSVEEIDKLADSFKQNGYFDNISPKQAYVRKINDSYEVYIPCNSTITTDPNAYKVFIPFRKSLQQSFPGNKIVINLVVASFDNVVKRLE